MKPIVEDEALQERIERILGKKLAEQLHLDVALTHRSYVNETNDQALEDNERYEFLGDAVLQLAVSDLLMRRHPEDAEGVLSKYRSAIVNEGALADAARSLNLGKAIKLGKGEELTQGRKKDSILANAFEAVVAAIYLSGGLADAATFVESCLKGHLEDIEARSEKHDFKTSLQELTQRAMKSAPQYRLVDEDGPDHEKSFETEVLIADRVFGRGRAKSKKESEQLAAQAALETLKVEGFPKIEPEES